ncbi:diguanylate cyclase phosphodiesterase domain-containing protein [Levilactobacillus koreensis JCM 16448]|uniref:Diguanylate cyclase n=1 Tax=Levilactobacillus koreensis TaxID=637971 RepID=A0AAC8UV13_9LACO|nr:GGDEF domain-containing protein [Levilactobacillus koreensis]AKP64403.1 diguanylate cyclase [Levilactobacillus koreensis]KRK90462.1 diguanylate cyclase phosphodiesterase domain-containing protein [Levilactobacillus koreensis JCM 16448]
MYLFENFFNDIFNIKSVIMALITVGLIAIMMVMTYLVAQRTARLSRTRTFILEIIEALVVVGGVLLLRQTFWVLNGGSVMSWGYAIAQLMILLYSMYAMQTLAVTLVNLAMPLVFYGQTVRLGASTQYWWVFMLTMAVLFGVIAYISQHQALVLKSEWRFLLIQFLYGGAWCLIIWSTHPYHLFYAINVLVVFIAYMWIIRFFVTRVNHVISHFASLDQAANYDELTGVRNRANFDTTTVGVFGVYRQHPTMPITMAMFDIDHFKNFNDNYGHLAGDAVLKHVAQLFNQELTTQTSHGELFRYGGEEFVIIFENIPPLDAQNEVTAIRNTLQKSPVTINGNKLTVTVSIGISELQPTDVDFDSWFKRVDHYLYLSKEAGRDRITVEGKTQKL